MRGVDVDSPKTVRPNTFERWAFGAALEKIVPIAFTASNGSSSGHEGGAFL
jgi:hypothetical protein